MIRFGLSLFLFLFSFSLFAQSTARIVGVIRDTSGAAVPGATVTATNTNTALSEVRTTTEEGIYTFPLLPVGSYQLEVSKDGFQKVLRSGLALTVNDNLTVDVVLTPGAVADSITITAATPILETQSGS